MSVDAHTEAIVTRWILPIAPENRILENAAVVLEDGRIRDVLAADVLAERWPGVPITRELSRHALLPGLVNAHGHAAMVLFRGFADDMALEPWLTERIWPLEARWMEAAFVADGTELALAEMLKTGTTCFSDMYFFPEAAAATAHRAGLRAQLTFPIVKFANAWSASAADALHKGLELHDAYRGHPRIDVAFGPHSVYANDVATLERIATLAEELQAPVQIHLHETAQEVADAVAATGERPLDLLERLGLLGPALQAVHMTQLQPSDYARLAEYDVAVIHCPQSNLKLASGFCPVTSLRHAGVRVALGTDSASSNNGLSMLREVNVAALLAKAVAGDARALPAREALRMATLAGAEVLGLGDRIGSLEPGKEADMIAVDLGGITSQPVFHPESQLVYAELGDAVSDVWVAGEPLLSRGEPTRLDEAAVTASAERWRRRIAQESGP